MNRHDTLGRSVELAHEQGTLAPLPQSEMKTLLSEVAEFYVGRAC